MWARSSRPGGQSHDFGLILPEVHNFARGVLPNKRPARTRRRFEMLEEVAIVADFVADEGPVEVKAWICWKLGAGLTGPAA